MDLKDKVVLVTGGGSGIGLAVASAFLDEGCRVVITGRSEEKLREAARSLSSPDKKLLWQVCDVSDRRAVQTLFQWIRQELGAVDILVNSAGINVPNRRWKDLDPADFDRVLNVNATGTFNCIYNALPDMRQTGDGLIINIVSIAGLQASLLAGLAYSAAKFAQSAIGLFTNLEEAAEGVRVTNIYPGETETPILDQRPEPPPAERRNKMLQPEDIAACAVFVAKLPKRAVVPQVVIVPSYQVYG